MPVGRIEQLISEMEKTVYPAQKCSFSECNNTPIRSHTISESNINKLNQPRTQLLILESSMFPRFKGQISKLFKPFDCDQFSTFFGFCWKHDQEIFRKLDTFQDSLTPELAALIHYRNICYGINHIENMQLQLKHLSESHFVEAEPPNMKGQHIHALIKSGQLDARLRYCLSEHIIRKKQLEKMILSKNFEGIEFLHFIGDLNNPIFCGRSPCVLHKNHDLFNHPGYSYMPWISYMTLIGNNQNYLIFCWLQQDNELALNLKNLCHNAVPKDVIELLAFAYSDSLVITKSFYDQHYEIINIISNGLRTV